MMGFGGIGYGSAWLWMLAGVLFVVGIAVLVVWAIGAAVGRPGEDEAIALLRARFARGEIDAAAFEQARQTLGATRPSGGRSRTPAIVGLALVAIARVAGLLAGALTPAGDGWSLRGMMGPWMMGGYGVAPTAPASTSVRMAGSRFEPAAQPGTAQHVAHARVADSPRSEARPRQGVGDGPLTMGRMLDGVGHDGVDQRRRQTSAGSRKRTRLGPQPGLAVLPIAGAQLVEATAADARLAAQAGHRRLTAFSPIHERLSQACQTVTRGRRPSSAVDCQTNSGSVHGVPLCMLRMSAFYAGSKY